MKKSKRLIKIFIVIALVIGLGVWIFNRIYIPTSDTLSISYASNASAYCSYTDFYVYDNTMYYLDRTGTKNVIKYVKNNIIRNFAKCTRDIERFFIINSNTAVVQCGKDICLIKNSDNKTVELWQGECVGCYKENVYFTKDNILYSAKIGQTKPDTVICFNELLAYDYTGITYRIGENIYLLHFENTSDSKLIISGEPPWIYDTNHFLVGTFLYTSDYALHIGAEGLEMYLYETGEIKQLYEIDRTEDRMVAMSIVAKENELYVSRQYMDNKLWPKKNQEVNGTYKYDITENVWTKINNKTFSVLAQFDEHYLYGQEEPFRFFPRVVRIKVD